MRLQKAAMFGLDARIALAIFGALSVISGAALYNAIQEARVVRIVTELDNLRKAWGQYYLDTGEPLGCLSHLENNAVCSNTTFTGYPTAYTPPSTWNGPYFDYSGLEELFPDGTIHAAFADEEAEIPNIISARCTDSAKSCYIYIDINDVGTSNIGLVHRLEEKIDGTLGTGSSNTNGKLRYHTWGSSPVKQALIYELGKFK